MERFLTRYAALAGVVFVVLVVVGFAVEGSSPSVSDGPGEIVDFYADNEARVKTGSALAAVGAVMLILFAIRLADVVRQQGSTLLSVAVVAGAVVVAAGMGVDSALRFALADSASEISPEATEALFAGWSAFFWPMHLGAAILVLAGSLHSLDSTLLPVWLAGLGIVGAVLVLIPVFAVLLIGVVAVSVWVLATSVLLYRHGASAR